MTNKGDYLGSCNRSACNNDHATFYNHSTRRYYCADCAKLINDVNRVDSMRIYGHDLCTSVDQTRMLMEKNAMDSGYYGLKWIFHKGKPILAGLLRFAFTTGLVYGIDASGYIGRYCFSHPDDARKTLESLNEVPEDYLIEGNWIKHKGYKEISNPNLAKQ